ncbi:GNAT family N-acetyltransferase [Candidatus Nomurabacteria bacterium]|nr:GNAT family N-acetyltransferase [Candidatus Nomurabacteria bacterium]
MISKEQLDTIPRVIAGTYGVVLRRLQVDDSERIFEILQSDPDISKYYVTWTAGIKSQEDVEARINNFVESHAARYGIFFNGELVGYIGIWKVVDNTREDEYDIGYFCDPKYRGQGVVTRATSALVASATQNVKVSSFALYIADRNQASQAVARNLGFTRTEETIVDEILKIEERRYERILPPAELSRNEHEHQVDVLTLPDLKPSGMTQSIVSAIRSNSWLHTSDVWLYRTKPELQLLFQQRPLNSPSYAGKLDCSAAGYLMAGESAKAGGARELYEELGVKVDPKDLTSSGRRLNAIIDHRGRERRIVANINIYQWEHELSDLKIDSKEVNAVFWVKAKDLLRIESGGKLKAVGEDSKGNKLEEEFGFDDFAYNIDGYYFRIAERLERRIKND